MVSFYDPTLPTPKDRIRALIGDVHSYATIAEVEDPMINDVTIEALLAQFPFNQAIRQICLSLIAQYANEPNKYDEGNGVKLEWSQRLDAWKALAEEYARTPDANHNRTGIAVGELTNPTLTKFRST